MLLHRRLQFSSAVDRATVYACQVNSISTLIKRRLAGRQGLAAPQQAQVGVATLATAAPGACALGPNRQILQVISIHFDNVHFRRDNPNVPSDLAQMPNLLKVIDRHPR